MPSDEEEMLSSCSDADEIEQEVCSSSSNDVGGKTWLKRLEDPMFPVPKKKKKKLLKRCGSNCMRFISDGEDDVLICDICKTRFHVMCTSFDNEVFKLLKEKEFFGGVFWKCNTCKEMAEEPL